MRSKVQKFFALLLAVSLLAGSVSSTAFAENASGDLADYEEEMGAADIEGSDGAGEDADQESGDDSWKYSNSSYEVVKGVEASNQAAVAEVDSQDGLENVPSIWHASALEPNGSATVYDDFDGSDEYYQKILDEAVRQNLAWNQHGVIISVSPEKMAEIAPEQDARQYWEEFRTRFSADFQTLLLESSGDYYNRYQAASGFGGMRITVAGPVEGLRENWEFSFGFFMRRNSVEEEQYVRRYVQALFSPGGELYRYRAGNDSTSQYQKYRAIWDWLGRHIRYGGGFSTYGAVTAGRTVCLGYSALNSLMCAYAGVENYQIIGITRTVMIGHAWNWVKIGPKWYTTDSTGQAGQGAYESAFLIPTQYTEDFNWWLDDKFTTPEIREKYPVYEEEYEDLLAENNPPDSGYIYDPETGVNLDWTLFNRTLTISGSGDMRDFADPYQVPWNSRFEYIDKVVIEEGVTSIGANAFYALPDIQRDNPATFQAPASITEEKIGRHAFYDPEDPVTELMGNMELIVNPSVRYDTRPIDYTDLVDVGRYGTQNATVSDYSYRYQGVGEENAWKAGTPTDVGEYMVEVTLKGKSLGGITYHSVTDVCRVTITKASYHIAGVWAVRPYDGTTRFTNDDIESVDYYCSHSGTGTPIQLGVDYDITGTYISPNAGTYRAYLEVTLRNTEKLKNYDVTWVSGAISTVYSMRKKDLTSDMFKEIPDQAWTGAAVTPNVVIADSEVEIMTYRDFTVQYSSNIDEGQATVTITGQNNYRGTVTLNFDISREIEPTPVLQTLNSSGSPSQAITYPEDFTIRLSGADSGENVTFYVADEKGGETEIGSAQVGTDGTATCSYDVSSKIIRGGAHTLVARDAGNTEIASSTVAILPKLVTVTFPDDFFAWKQYDGTNKVIQTPDYANNLELTATGVEDGDEVQVDAEIAYDSASVGLRQVIAERITLGGEDGDYYAVSGRQDWISSDYAIGIARANLTPTFRFSNGSTDSPVKEFDGLPDVLVESVEFEGLAEGEELVDGVDYTISTSYESINAGEQTATITIEFANGGTTNDRYSLSNGGVYTFDGEITAIPLEDSMFEPIGQQEYTGDQITPQVTPSSSATLLAGNYEIVSYGDNISDTGTVTIQGINNYTGEVTLTFPISGGVARPVLTGEAYNGSAQTNRFTYGEGVTIRGTAMKGGSPVTGQVALYAGDTLLGTADVESNGSYSIRYATVEKGIPATGESTQLELSLTDDSSEGSLATAGVSVSLSPMQVRASLTGNATKVYDGTTALPEEHTVEVDLDGVLVADERVLSATASYQFEIASAGTKTITASDVTLVTAETDPAVASFYRLENGEGLTTTVVGGITPATLRAEITAENKAYDGTANAEATVTFEGLVGDERLTADEDYTVSAAFDSKDAGTEKTVTATIALTNEGDSANYRFGEDGDTETTASTQADITPLMLGETMFASIPDQPWTGRQISPDVSIAEGQTLLTKDDFEVTYGTNMEETGTVTIRGVRNFTGEVILTFRIICGPQKPAISASTYKGNTETDAFTYGDTITIKGAATLNHDASQGTAALYVDGEPVGSPVDVNRDGTYTIDYDTTSKAIPASGEPVVLELRLNDDTEENAASVETSITLSPKEVTANLSGDAKKTYDGTVAVPDGHSLKLSLEGVLEADRSNVSANADHRFADVKAGTTGVLAANVVLINTSEDSGAAGFYRLAAQEKISAQVTGGITPAVLTITGEAEDKVYDGSADADAVVTFRGLQNEETLILGADYRVSAQFADGNVGNDKQVTVEVTFSDSETAANYTFSSGTGTAAKTASCTAQADILPITLAAEMFAPIGNQTYTGGPITPEVVLADAYEALLGTDDYEAEYRDNTEAGTATVTITGKNNAQGSVGLTFEINGLQTRLSVQAQDEAGNPKTQFTYGDTIRLSGSLETEAASAYTLRNAAAQPGQGQVALYVGNTQAAEPQSVSLDSSTFAFEIDTAGKTIPAGDVTFTLQYTGNASLGASETELSIHLDKVLLTPQAETPGTVTKTFDGTVDVPADQAPPITLSGAVVNGDTPVLAAPVWTYASAGASDSVDIIGTGLALEGTWQSWYTLSTDTITLPGAGRIEKADTAPGEEAMVLPAGVADASMTKALSGLVPDNAGGTPVYEVLNFTASGLASAGINELGELSLVAKAEADTSMTDTVTVKVSGMANYNDFTIEVAVTYVEQTPISITLIPTLTDLIYTAQQTQGYGGLEATYTDASGITHTFDAAALSYVYEGMTRQGEAYGPISTPPTQAGSYKVTASVPQTEALFTGSASLSFTIEPASLVIRADNVEVVQGQPLPALTYTVEGMMAGDSLLTEPVLTPSVTDTSLPGIYTIGISGASASANYIIAGYEPAVLTITEAPAPDSEPQVPPADGNGSQNTTGGNNAAQNPASDASVLQNDAVLPTTGRAAVPPRTGDGSGSGLNIPGLAGALVLIVFAGLYKKRNRIRRKR